MPAAVVLCIRKVAHPLKKYESGPTLLFTASMLIFGTIGIFRRSIPLPSPMLACFRGITGALFLLAVIFLRKRSLRFHVSPSQAGWLALTGALIGFNWMLLFEAYNYTTVATATLCYYMQPTIVILLSPVFFREKLTLRKALCALIAVAGMVLVSGIIGDTAQGSGNTRGILLGLGAAALYASVIILNKRLPGIDPYEKTVIQLSAAGLVMIPYLLFTREFSFTGLDGMGLLCLVIVGLVHTGIAYAIYFSSMDKLKAQTVAILSYIDPITALLLSALFLREPMGLTGIIGTVMILGATAASELMPGKE